LTLPYYEIFGLEPRLTVDAADLQRRFYDLSRTLHPDRFQQKGEAERLQAEERMAVLNDAFRTLRDPVARAEYMLQANGFDVGEQRGKDVPEELLEEVFELNMALEELRGGDASARPQLEAARRKFLAMREEADARLAELSAHYDGGGGPAVLPEIRALLNRRRYIRNLVRDVEKELAS